MGPTYKNNKHNGHGIKTYWSISVKSKPSEEEVCIDTLADSMTLIPSVNAKFLLTCIGTYTKFEEKILFVVKKWHLH